MVIINALHSNHVSLEIVREAWDHDEVDQSEEPPKPALLTVPAGPSEEIRKPASPDGSESEIIITDGSNDAIMSFIKESLMGLLRE